MAEDLTYPKAARLVQGALRAADDLGVPVSVAVVDAGRELVAFARQSGAPLLSSEVARSKAFTARSLDLPTSEVGKLTQPGAPLFGLETATRHRICTFGGGVPLTVDGEIVGAIGVSGGTVQQDEQIAATAAEGLQ